MNILYLVNFNLGEKKGLGLITKQKANALRSLGCDVKAMGSPFSNSYLKIISGFFLDFIAACYVAFKRPGCIISRGPVGLLTTFVSKLIGVKTVREVHAYAMQEVDLLRYSGANRLFLKLMAHFSHYLDVRSDLRIFNHPELLEFYRRSGFSRDVDFCSYNGFATENASSMSKSVALQKFNLPERYKYLVFVGSATKWHGVEYLIDLQKEFLLNNDPVRVVFGGAPISDFDPEGVCLNITPLESSGCADLIKASDLCLLPVKNNRVSPGSPLKLYDYMVNERRVVAQEGVLGYCDEVINHNIGICVDFANPKDARDKILDFLSSSDNSGAYPKIPASWQDRMAEWVNAINKLYS